MTSTNYQNQVRAAAAALKRGEDANWELAELTTTNTNDRGDTEIQINKVTMEKWCADVREQSGRKFAAITGRWYKAIWLKYGRYNGSDRPTWTEAYNDIRGVQNMDANMVGTNFKRAIAYATPEQKVEAFTTLAREPDVAATAVSALVNNPTVAAQAFKEIAKQSEVVTKVLQDDLPTAGAMRSAQYEATREATDNYRRGNQTMRERNEQSALESPELTNNLFLSSATRTVEGWSLQLTSLRNQLQQVMQMKTDQGLAWKLRQQMVDLQQQSQTVIDLLPERWDSANGAPKDDRPLRAIS